MAKKVTRQAKDAAGIGPYAQERARLVPISQLKGWSVAKGEADIRSWEVKTVSGRVLGHVKDLLVDEKAGEVVMIDVDLAGSDRHACVPLRVVEVDRVRRVVRADSSDLEEGDIADRTRLSAAELSQVREDERSARPARDRGAAEKVVERRPIVEETVVRRREAADLEADRDSDTRL